jgi:hypothetical protein
MPQLSHGTMFVWSAADAETRQAKALEIEPVHFLLALTKLAELPEQARVDSRFQSTRCFSQLGMIAIVRTSHSWKRGTKSVVGSRSRIACWMSGARFVQKYIVWLRQTWEVCNFLKMW